jgi:hypothetical protein
MPSTRVFAGVELIPDPVPTTTWFATVISWNGRALTLESMPFEVVRA